MKKALVLIDWIGCPRNVLLKLRIEDYLKANKWKVLSSVDDLKKSDLVVFASCGFTYVQQKRSLSIIKGVYEKLEKLNKEPLFVVTGCLPPINRDELRAIHAGPAFGPRELDKFDEIINAKIKISDIPLRTEIKHKERKRVTIEKKRWHWSIKMLNATHKSVRNFRKKFDPYKDHAFDHYQMGDEIWSVTTSSGCRGKCSYCAIRFSKGPLKSRPIADIIAEIQKGVDLGYQWISLIADDNGVYGQDIGTDFGELLREINKIEGDFSLLLDSLAGEHFLEFFEEIKAVCGSQKMLKLMLGLQHVDSEILSSMRRPYDVGMLKKRIVELQEAIPSLAIDAHFIVAYPGETDEKFQSLVDFINWIYEVNPENEFKSFKFSANPGTEAATLPDQISSKAALKRCYILEKMAYNREKRLRKEAIRHIKNPLKRGMVRTGHFFLGKPSMAMEKLFFWARTSLEYDVMNEVNVCPNTKILPKAQLQAVQVEGEKRI